MLESEVLNRMQRRIVKNFLDVFILIELQKGSLLGGSDFIRLIDGRFNTLLSSGIVHSCLYSLEREGLIEGENAEKKKVYALTEKGRQTARRLLSMKHKILGLVLNLFIGG